MALDQDKLGDELYGALGSTADKDGNSTDTSSEAKTYAKAFVTALKAAKTTHALIEGNGIPNGGPFKGSAKNGKIIALVPDIAAGVIEGANPKAAPGAVKTEITAAFNYIMASANVVFDLIEGIDTAATGSPPTPGALVKGEGKGGVIKDLDGSAMAAMVGSATGGSGPDLVKWYSALCKHIMKNAEVMYPPGTVQGSFGPGGGSLTGGMAMNGIIS